MRFKTYLMSMLLVTAAARTVEAEAWRFSRPKWMSDLALSLPLAEGFAANPAEMPQAAAYLVNEGGRYRLEDRFDAFELWAAKTLRGRWRDATGNEFMIARLDSLLPSAEAGDSVTRDGFRRELKPLKVKDAAARDAAVAALLPMELLPPVRTRRQGRRNLLELWRYPVTNSTALVYAFRPRSPERKETPGWYMVAAVVAPGMDLGEVEERLESDFFDEVTLPPARERTSVPPPLPPEATETDLLAEDYRLNVANYADWNFFRAGDLMITDNLGAQFRLPFIATITNELPRLRREYARSVPPALADGFHPAVIRVFNSREEYLAYVGVEARWTAAVWCPPRRELVLYFSEEGVEATLRTVWHEAFHQYLSYSGSMISASPWINEGHAEVFEHSHFDSKGGLVHDRVPEWAAFINVNAVKLAEAIPALLAMDYEEFYGGDQFAREDKYRLAWSIAYFLQVGASEVRFQPFAKTRAEYLAELVKTRSAAAATQKVLSGEKLDDFIAEWVKFWRRE